MVKARSAIDSILPQYEPLADSTDMAMPSSLDRILNTGTALVGELQHSQVQPLHLVTGEMGNVSPIALRNESETKVLPN